MSVNTGRQWVTSESWTQDM